MLIDAGGPVDAIGLVDLVRRVYEVAKKTMKEQQHWMIISNLE
ncbi:hypothetical protein [Ancylothrix sp. D3o]|nr:hypothetical protein [Ancylothrix sp. D3o]